MARYSARLRLLALALELGRFQIAYGAPTASANGSSESGRLPLGVGGSKIEFDVSDDRHIQSSFEGLLGFPNGQDASRDQAAGLEHEDDRRG